MMSPSSWAGAGCLLLCALAQPALADAPDPLRLVPAEAGVVIKVERPAALLRSVAALQAFQDLQKIDAVRELLESTNTRRFQQLIGYFEKKLGAKDYYDMLDRVAGGGIVVSAKLEKNAPALIVIQGKDEKAVQEFVKLAVEVVEQELARQDSKEKIQRGKYHGVDGYRIGKDFFLTAVGDTVLIANKNGALKAGLDLHLGKGGKSIAGGKKLAEGRKLLAPSPVVWMWLDMDGVRKLPESKQLFEQATGPGSFLTNLSFAGGMIDAARRSPSLVAGLYQKDNGYTLTVRIPRGLKGMHEKVAGFFPKGKGATLPLLEPPNTLASGSFYLDLADFWKNRTKLMNEMDLKGLEDFEQQSGRFLGGVKMSQLFEQSGSHYRVVVTQPTESVYKKKPKFPLQAYGIVHEMRDPQLARSLDRMLRTVALFGAAGVNVKMVEEKHGDVLLVTYRFPEGRPLQGDEQDIRFGFSPCFAKVGNQFMVASTVELGRNLVKTLQMEQERKPQPHLMNVKVYAAGTAVALQQAKDQVVTQFVLGQAMPIEEAQKQFDALIEILRRSGTAQFSTVYGENEFRADIVIDLGKK